MLKVRPILALHGSASAGGLWRALGERLGADRRMLAPDLPGYGERLGRLDPSASDRFDWLADAMDPLGERFDIVAHSFGGAVAVYLANTRPDRVASVTVYEPIVPPGGRVDAASPMRDLEDLWRRAQRSDPRAAMRMFSTFWSGAGSWDALSAGAQARLIAAYPGLLLDFEQVFGGQLDVAEPSFGGPLSIIRGDRSPPVARRMAEALAETFPQSERVVLNGLGHLGPATHPETVNPVFVRCLNRATD